MSGRRPPPRLIAACASIFASLPAVAAAQVPPYSQPLPTWPFPWPWSQPAPPPPPNPQPGYQPLPNNKEDVATGRRARSWPILRLSSGAGFTFWSAGELLPSFVLDVAAGYRWAFHRNVFLTIEGGYTHDTEPSIGGNFGAIGAGPELYTGYYVGVGWMPKLVIGETWQGFGIGVRNTLTVPLFHRIFSVELGHQYLRVDGRLDQHELRAQAGIDLAAMVYLYVRRRVGGTR